jgi:hypothetical protein
MTNELALPNLMDDMLVGISMGRQAHISTDNKEWQAVVGKESRSIGMWDDVAKATYLEFILVGLAKHPLRLHFPLAPKDPNIPGPAQVSTYDPKNKQPPVCTSENGIGPSVESRSPQSAFCSNCWAKEWGSALSQRGEKIPACTTKKRLAVIVPSFSWDTVLQFDIPPAAFTNWGSLLQMMRDGRITRVESVMIRAYFIANEEGFIRFTLSPLGYNEQFHGPNSTPIIHRHMLSSETQALLGANDRPIDPATWAPALAAPAGQPALAYTPAAQPAQQFNQQQGPNQAYAGGGAGSGYAQPNQGYANQPGGGYQQQPTEQPVRHVYQVQHGPATGAQQVAGPDAYETGDVEYDAPAQNQPTDTHSGAAIEGEAAKSKRTRRTKAQIEADNAAKAAPASPQGAYGMAQGSPATDALRGQLNSAMGLTPPR